MIEQLEEQIKVVALARKRVVILRETKADRLKKWEEDNKELIDTLATVAEDVATEEGVLHELTLQAYAETGNKVPAVGVGIREITRLEYDNKTAFDWAVGHTMALKLDVSAFEKIVKASPLDFVKVTKEPQATIATQLDIGEK